VNEKGRDWEGFWLELLRQRSFQEDQENMGLPPRPIIAQYMWGGGIPLESMELARLSQNLLPKGTLEVRRVMYSSPGMTDLAGVGSIIGHIKDIILRIIEWRIQRDERELNNKKRILENEHAQAELSRIRIENAQKLVEIAKQCGYSEAELRKMVAFSDTRQEVIVRSIEDGRIRAVRLLEGSDCEKASAD
jgi:hypothetical protein